MSDPEQRIGPFHYSGSEGFEAWGYRFPSGFIVLEWIPESVPDGEETYERGHQSIYHSLSDMQVSCDGEITWGRIPDTTPVGARDLLQTHD